MNVKKIVLPLVLLTAAGTTASAQDCADLCDYRYWWDATTESVQTAIDGGFNPNVTDGDGNTPLVQAASNTSDAAIIKILLDAGADVNTPGQWGQTPIHAALSGTDNIDVVKLLVDAGADLSQPNGSGYHVIHSAADGKLPEAFGLMVEMTGVTAAEVLADGDRTALFMAVGDSRPNFDMVKAIHEAGVPLTAEARGGEQAIHALSRFAQRGGDEIMTYFIENGADVNAVGIDNDTPLSRAARNNRGGGPLIELLLAAGADACLADEDGVTPLGHVDEDDDKLRESEGFRLLQEASESC